LTIAVCLILLVQKKKFHGIPLVLIALFVVYAIFGMGKNYTTVGKICAGLLLLYVFISSVSPYNFKNHILSFGLGLLGSSVLGTVKDSWGKLAIYFSDIDYVYVNGERTFRFSGLNYDPNYYAIGVILLVFLCLRLLLNKEGNRPFLGALICVMVLFGFTSYSKMFLLAIAILALFFILYKTKTPKQVVLTLSSVAAIFSVFFWWASRYGYLNTILDRLTQDDISTGRFEIWERYLEYLRSSSWTLLFGDGFRASYLSTAPHNTYIEALFFLGIVGTVLFAVTICSIFFCRQINIKRGVINLSPLIIFGVMIALLGCLTINELPFFLMLLWIGLNFEAPDEHRVILEKEGLWKTKKNKNKKSNQQL
jgi:O-antigen ligase